jgi:hypothetical protein
MNNALQFIFRSLLTLNIHMMNMILYQFTLQSESNIASNVVVDIILAESTAVVHSI